MAAPPRKRESRKAQTPIPKRMREVRARLGLSQSQLGSALKLDRDVAITRISQYELGTHSPVYSLIERLAEFSKIPEPYFFADDDDLAALISVFGELTPAARQKLLQTATEIRDMPGNKTGE